MTDMPTSQTSFQLYSCADESVQNAIINTYPKFFTTDSDRLLNMIEELVTQRSNPMVHRITFTSMSQHEDELSTNSRLSFTSSIFQEFLWTCCVKHRLSSVVYPQCNGLAELVVKTAKRVVNGNTSPQGSLDNDNVAQAILQYWNNPIQSIGQSPVQLLLHHQHHDSIPSQPIFYKPHPEWVVVVQCHKKIFHYRNAKIVESYNKYTHNLPPLQTGDTVAI